MAPWLMSVEPYRKPFSNGRASFAFLQTISARSEFPGVEEGATGGVAASSAASQPSPHATQFALR